MAVMAKKGKREVPAMSTSSLPDIVFMLLFFFMAATTMREVDPLVKVQMPQANEITELDKKNLVNIWMGKPMNAAKGEDALKIQLNDIEAQNIRKAVPMKISEAEPNDQTKK